MSRSLPISLGLLLVLATATPFVVLAAPNPAGPAKLGASPASAAASASVAATAAASASKAKNPSFKAGKALKDAIQ